MENNEILRIEHIRKIFDNNVIFGDFNTSVKEGEVVVIIGSSGCGKSTLLRIINGLEPVQGGSIYLNGQNILADAKTLQKAREKVGMVFQSYDLFPHKNVLNNITLAPIKVQKRNKTEAEAEARELLQKVGLSDKEDAFPRQLSGGQKQRVAIARALAMHPEILLLDEITAALDPEMVREVLDTVLELARGGKTMLIVTHEMAFARAIADRVLFIDEGKIAEESREPKEFFAHPKTERAQRFLRTFEFE